MVKRTPAEEPKQPQRSGPPPLREKEPKREPKPKPKLKLSVRLGNIIRVLRHPTIGTLRRDMGHFLLYGLYMFVGIFLLGAFVSFGGPPSRDMDERNAYPEIAKIGHTTLERTKFEENLRARRILSDEMFTQRFQTIGMMFDRWVDQQLITLAAKRRKVAVTNADFDKEVAKQADQKLKAERGNLSERDWKYRLQQQGKSAADEVASARKELADKAGPDLRANLLEDKLHKNLDAEVKITDQDLADKYNEVSGFVALVRVDQRKPPEPPKDKAEKPEDAKIRAEQQKKYEEGLAAKKTAAEGVLAKLKADPKQFDTIAKAAIPDYGKGQGGKFGPAAAEAYDITRYGDDYKKAVFALEIGKVSELIKTDEGWAVATVTAKKTWPTDFEKPEPRSFEDAEKVAADLAAQLAKGADFAQLAKEKSDDPGSKDKGGEYDLTARGVWVKPFEKMAFALQDKEISKPFRTRFGVHIMQVMEREMPEKGEVIKDDDPAADEGKTEEDKQKEANELKALPLPDHKDLAKAKRVKVRHILIKAEDPKQKIEDKKKQLQNEKQGKHWDEFLKKEREQAYKSGLIQVFDPELKAYLASKDNKTEEQLFWLRVAARTWPRGKGEVHFELGKMYEQRGGISAPGGAKVAAVKALAKYPAEQVVPDLVKALDTFEPDVRKAVLNTLGELKSKDLTSLAKMRTIVQTDPDDSVAQAAQEALKKIGVEVPERKKPAALPTPADVGAKPAPAPSGAKQ